VKAHVHKDSAATVARVLAFGQASPETQLAVLSELRSRVTDNSLTVEIAFGAAAISLAALFVGQQHVAPTTVTWPSQLVVGLFLVVALSPIFLPQLRRSRSQTVAAVWLAAYEDELARRWLATGRRARQWRNARVTWDD
jgi:ribose 1,5-bisphosphokinase PhnN